MSSTWMPVNIALPTDGSGTLYQVIWLDVVGGRIESDFGLAYFDRPVSQGGNGNGWVMPSNNPDELDQCVTVSHWRPLGKLPTSGADGMTLEAFTARYGERPPLGCLPRLPLGMPEK